MASQAAMGLGQKSNVDRDHGLLPIDSHLSTRQGTAVGGTLDSQNKPLSAFDMDSVLCGKIPTAKKAHSSWLSAMRFFACD